MSKPVRRRKLCAASRGGLTGYVGIEDDEVKSAQHGSSYEYQYHKNTGKDKLVPGLNRPTFFDA